LFGGAERVTELLSAISPSSVKDVTAPSFVPETPSQGVAAADIRAGVAAAVFPGYGGSFLVLVGLDFILGNPGYQVGIMAHELLHVVVSDHAWVDGPEGIVALVEACFK
jgi:hypothetical protein